MVAKNATIARRLASQMWGEVQTQLKVADGIWSYTTAGHGGFIVDIYLHPELAEYKSVVYRDRRTNEYFPSEQHFAPFEEDCEYAKVIWLYPYVLKKLSKNYSKVDKTNFEKWQQEQLGYAKRSLEQWNPDFLQKHPKHGKLIK